ncbi:hypothetical protein CC86DRAFT_420405 [Ophiobolus disseminans]|uniref:Uncharacterized protein n=1 Tax=Ophiobolus disseminans TaxID=1469910 RepID=A0A6A6ZVX7_9PLEO|nr:hypothetical protein CC86DRAFT_420405 [Ophiobolus disseminans]
MGLILSSKTIKEEITEKYIKQRREYIASEVPRWSNKYRAPIRIVDPVSLQDITAPEVQLPASMFTQEWVPVPRPRGAPPPCDPRFQKKNLMSALHISHIKITTYKDTEDEVEQPLIYKYAQNLDETVFLGHFSSKLSFN